MVAEASQLRIVAWSIRDVNFRPPEAIAAVRSILREKESLTARRTQAIQQMQKSLDQMNIRVHHAVSDIDGKLN